MKRTYQTGGSVRSEGERVNAKNLVLSIFILLTMLFASLTLIEHGQVGTFTTTTTIMSQTVVVRTVVVYTNNMPFTSTKVSCTSSGPTNGVVLRVVANNGSWEGLKVSGEAVGYCGSARYVILNLSTGNVTTHFCEYNLPFGSPGCPAFTPY